MIIQVTPHTITITKTEDINAGEYNITTCTFEFSEEFNDLTNMAVFSTCGNSYKTPILNNQCIIPYEVLEEPGNVLLGVYGYEGEEDLTLRYSPTPQYFNVDYGSYKEAGDPELPPKSEWEQLVEEVNEAITEANNLNVSATKDGTVTTITVTKKDGTTYQVQILDGEKGDKGDKGDPGAIKMQIVNVLPETGAEDTIYLVPIEEPETGNNYDEYIYVNGAWEKLGGVQVQVDLTDYVKNTDYATNNVGGVVRTGYYHFYTTNDGRPYTDTVTYANYPNLSDVSFIGKGTLEAVITGKNLETANNKVTSISASSTDTQYPTAKCMYDLVGNVETLLEVLDIGSGARELE